MNLSNINKPVASILFDGVLRFTVVKVIDGTIKDSSSVPFDAIWTVDDVTAKTNNRTRVVRLYGGLDAFVSLFRDMQWKDARGHTRKFMREGEVRTEVAYGLSTNDEAIRTEEETIPGAYPVSMRLPKEYNTWWLIMLGICLSYENKLRATFAEGLSENEMGDEVARWILSGEESPLYDAMIKKNVVCPSADLQYSPTEAIISLVAYCNIPMDFIKHSKNKIKPWKPRIYSNDHYEIDLPHKPNSGTKDALLAFKTTEPVEELKINDITYQLRAGVLNDKIGIVKKGKYWMSFDESGLDGVCPVLHLHKQASWLEELHWMIPSASGAEFDNSVWFYCKK